MNDNFTLVSWNLFQGLHHSSKPNAWVQNLPIADHVASLDADVLVLPEAWQHRQANARWAENFAARLGYELHQWVADKPNRPEEVAPWRMVIMTRIPAQRLEDHILPATRGNSQRAIVRVKLTDSDLTLAGAHLYGIHLLMGRKPRGWLGERSELRKATASSDIVAGDLNMWAPVVRRDAGALRSAVKGRTFPAKRPHSQIDHVLVSDRVQVVSSDVLPEMGSDHLGLITVLRPC